MPIEEGDEAIDALPGARPGFQLPLTIDPTEDYLADFTELLNKAEWGKAFRLLTELSDEQMRAIAPTGDRLAFAPVREQVREQLLGLGPEGLRAYRLYFDAQANERFEAIQRHPLPGSDDQLELLQKLLDRFYATTVGARAAAMAGDLYFERGLFARAERSWALAVEHDQTDGGAIAGLQARRVLALARAGESEQAAALYAALRARYDALPIQVGGDRVDALAWLSGVVEPAGAAQDPPASARSLPLELPDQAAGPLWHLRFFDRASQSRANSTNNNYYRTPQDLKRLVPDVVADDQRVYFAYQGVAFALDRRTGKARWVTGGPGAVGEAAEQTGARMSNNAGDPRNYAIAQSADTLLVNTPRPTNDNNAYFELVGLDKRTGRERWRSTAVPGWGRLANSGDSSRPVSVLGEPLVADRAGYAVVHRAGSATCFLRRFDPDTGAIDWTLLLGTADPIVFQYTNVSRMPQPRMVANQGMLHVLIGSGVLVTVDTTDEHLKWAVQLDLPFGQSREDAPLHQRNGYTSRVEQFANPNGSGSLRLRGGVLYAKQHLGGTLYAIDPRRGEVLWRAGGLDPDAKLVGIDDKRFYLMDTAIRGYRIDGEHDLLWNNKRDTGRPIHAGALIAGDRIMILGDNRLKLIKTENGDPAGAYRDDDYLGSAGGNLYRFDDLLIAIDQTQVTAYPLGRNSDPPSN